MKIITYIHWRDACIEEAADPDTPISPDPLVDLYEVGYLIAETEDAVSIAMEWVPIQENNLAEPGGKPLSLAHPQSQHRRASGFRRREAGEAAPED